MSQRVSLWLTVLLTTLVVVVIQQSSMAKDIFLTIGGGYGATSTQLSLERNVLFQQSVLSEKRTDAPKHVVLFADGDDPTPDVQCRDPEFNQTCPPARKMMAELLGDSDQMDIFYRTNQIANLQGPSRAATVKQQLRSIAREVKSGDRVFIYATAHGGPAEEDSYDSYSDYEYDEDTGEWTSKLEDIDAEPEDNKYNTSLYFHDGESVTASEFSAWLDRMPRDAQVVLVMVQCYAGGFSHTIFHDADSDLGLSPHARCGFFVQVHDRGAAGCTPNANEGDYEEYSSYFWGALAGHSRTGKALESADYNQDGKVSFAEAHAYAIIESETIDIPIRTSDAFLRHYSNIGKPDDEQDDESGNPLKQLFGLLATEPAKEAGQELRQYQGSIAELAEIAHTDRKAILQQLPERLELGDNPTIESVQLAVKKTGAESKIARVRWATSAQNYTQLQKRVKDQLLETWPELHSDYSPLAMALTNERAEEFVATVKNLAAYEGMNRAKESRDKHSAEAQALMHREAKLQRLLHVCKSVVLAENLPKLMPAELVDRYEKLVAMEEGSL